MAARILKASTGLTGLPVSQNPRKMLLHLYGLTFESLEKMPASAAYRKNTEKILKHRVDIVKSTEDIIQIEKKINCGQIEEIIVQAKNELSLARRMLIWQPWEPLLGDAPKDQWKWPI
ncbi:NADH dehydrogenase [ubiquinone] 1 alpha subcomplex subunit 5 [Lingula anatina]|uniref:NADH dehydrogenase [ubiquinone] 1 alpha subcomplex subunit 5 n=1 Tax=Lingula anatina TaxID=7574 RepID=A0A1S3JCE0_LINAN|nr:NADH dehydrogenase [ubiquinone] 1 alpha subcomplex subunit 5 [Lingula anatina]|eukprot:XP_013408067.1 NADH dehydrogenase [ubiquinone] 1 alpha subcomplex subunit 5 [Lingula anatina]